MEACVSPYNVLWSWTKTSQSRKTRHERTIIKPIGPHLPKQNENNNILRKQRHFNSKGLILVNAVKKRETWCLIATFHNS